MPTNRSPFCEGEQIVQCCRIYGEKLGRFRLGESLGET